MDSQKNISDIVTFLNTRREVLLAFVFGSFLEDRLTGESDVDVAILFKEMPDLSQLSEIMEGISRITGRETDIVVLNDASPIIKMQVLKKGRVIKKVNESVYNEFFSRTIKEYDDLKRVRREQEEKILRGRIYARA
ncbi:MAG: nucleotidyltransferase domain-containing protein [Nitrospirae bacterium]|nr:nucleotidyltransferase domain-containing protein [Nitrospirota bacterium]